MVLYLPYSLFKSYFDKITKAGATYYFPLKPIHSSLIKSSSSLSMLHIVGIKFVLANVVIDQLS